MSLIRELDGGPRNYANGDPRLFLSGNGRYVDSSISGCRWRFYLAGPMRGLPMSNFPAFLTATRVLTSRGLSIISPAEKDIEAGFDFTRPAEEQKFDMAAAFVWDFKAILDAEGIILLPGWENSEGAKAERAVAQLCRKQILLLSDSFELRSADPMSCVVQFQALPPTKKDNARKPLHYNEDLQ